MNSSPICPLWVAWTGIYGVGHKINSFQLPVFSSDQNPSCTGQNEWTNLLFEKTNKKWTVVFFCVRLFHKKWGNRCRLSRNIESNNDAASPKQSSKHNFDPWKDSYDRSFQTNLYFRRLAEVTGFCSIKSSNFCKKNYHENTIFTSSNVPNKNC